ncbi:helix-turn-helix transcriptional regulator [Palleronia rufa]|uniref:helix-turn-helix transcriptional regulator n=1 Tax=Palleronia rufa TaxID=1530186 RepID=UPI000561C324|nr:LuxR C-terminal-related transcriptional regulator [Palleronia rufa]
MARSLTPEVVTDLALLAIEAAARPEAWCALCDRVAGEIGAKAFIILAYDLHDHSMPQVFGSGAIHSPDGRAMTKAARQGEGTEDLSTYEALARQPPGLVISEHDLRGSGERGVGAVNRWRERMLAITGGRDRSVMKLNDVGPFLDCVAVHDALPHAGPLPLTPVAPIVHPLLARTIETTRVVNALAESHKRLMTLFDRLDFGAAFCTPSGRVITANDAFREVARNGGGLHDTAHGVVANDSTETYRLRSLIAAAAHPTTPPEHLTLALSRRRRRLPLVLYAAPAQDRDLGPTTAVLLLAVDPEDGTRLNARGLAALGVLTEAELEVCNLLVQGFETTTIAEQRGTQPDTVRDQIKAAAAKLACRSRIDILRLAMATATAVRN